MIVVGRATVNPDTGNVELIAPLGFATARGVRISNFNTDTVILSNVSGTDQSQEYLMPQQQMVYPSANVGRIPTADGLSLPASQISTNLLVEWSTDPDADFLGTYPAALPSQISSTNGTTETNSLPGVAGSAIVGAATPLGTVPGEFGLLAYNIHGTGVPFTYLISVAEIDASGPSVGTSASQLISGIDDTIIHGAIPFRLTHVKPVSLIVVQLVGATPNTVDVSLFSLNNSELDVPLVYADLVRPLQFTTTTVGAPVAGTPIQLLGTWDGAFNGLCDISTGELLATLMITTSGHGKSTDGWIGFGTAPPPGEIPIITTGDTHTIAGTASDTLIGYRPVDLGPSNTGNAGPPTMNVDSTTDTGAITVVLTLAQRRPQYSLYDGV